MVPAVVAAAHLAAARPARIRRASLKPIRGWTTSWPAAAASATYRPKDTVMPRPGSGRGQHAGAVRAGTVRGGTVRGGMVRGDMVRGGEQLRGEPAQPGQVVAGEHGVEAGRAQPGGLARRPGRPPRPACRR